MGWEIAPDAFRAVMIEAKERYSGDLPVYILENGAAFPDRVEADGHIRDERRISYLRGYLGAVQDAIAAGVPVKGYFVWSLLDNFEWTLGYSKRFGLVHVDYETQQPPPQGLVPLLRRAGRRRRPRTGIAAERGSRLRMCRLAA